MDPKTPKAIIIMEDGNIFKVLCSENIDIAIIDYDTESGEKEDYIPIPQPDGNMTEAYVYQGEYLELNPSRVTEIMGAIKSYVPPVRLIPVIACSSYGSITFDSKTGNIISTNLDNSPECPQVARFDVEEFKCHYGEYPKNETDILDLGYWQNDGGYEPPCHDWRREVAILRTGEGPEGLSSLGQQNAVPKVLINVIADNYANAELIIPNVNLHLLEAQRRAFLKYTSHIGSFQGERDGLENFLNTICDAYYDKSNGANTFSEIENPLSFEGSLQTKIGTIDEAKSFIRMLHRTGNMFHLEDDPHGVDFAKPLPDNQLDDLEIRVNEIYGLDWKEGGYGCPLGYYLQEVDPNFFDAFDTGYEPIPASELLSSIEAVPPVEPNPHVPDLSEVSEIAVIMGYSIAETMVQANADRNIGTVETIAIIAEWAIEFEKKFAPVCEWSEEVYDNPSKWGLPEGVCDWEDAICEFARQKFNAYCLIQH